MNDKIAKQIEEMKKQTIGVEVEMNTITRQKAARVTAEFFGTIDGVYLIALLQKILGVVAGTAAEIEDCSCGRELPEEFVLGGAEIGEASIGCEGVRVLIVII